LRFEFVKTPELKVNGVLEIEALLNSSITLIPEYFSLLKVRTSASSKVGPLSTTTLI
jgi:hypothetical protein